METERIDGPKLVDQANLCRVIDVNVDTWRKWVQQGKAPLPHATIGAKRFYRAADLRAFVRDGVWPAHMRYKGQSAPSAADAEALHALD